LTGSAQVEKYLFEQITTEDGLSNGGVTCLAQDKTGFLWIGTMDGLNRYDGVSFKAFRHDPLDTTSLSSNEVSCLLVDRQGVLWVGTRDNGLNRYDAEREHFDRLQRVPDDSLGKGLIHNAINALLEDKDGHIWVGTQQGLNRYTPALDSFKTFTSMPFDPTTLASNTVWCIEQDAFGFLWFGTSAGLSRFDSRSDAFETYRISEQGLVNNQVTSIREEKPGWIWVGTSDGLNLMHVSEDGQVTFKSYKDPNDARRSSQHVNCLARGQDGSMWLGSSGLGLGKLRRTGAGNIEISYLQNSPSLPRTLSSNIVTAILNDRDGNLWVGTQSKGLNKYAPYRYKFQNFQADPDVPGGLPENDIHAVLKDSQGNLWFGLESGLALLPAGKAGFLLMGPGLEGLDVRCIMEAEGQIWLGNSHGVFRRDGEGFEAVDLLSLGKPVELPIRRLACMTDSSIWAAGQNSLFRFDPRLDAFEEVYVFPNRIGLDELEINDLHLDSDSILWLATNASLIRFPINQKKPEYLQNDPEQARSLPSSNITAIAAFAKDSTHLWLGTIGGGLVHFDTRSLECVAFTQDDNLPHDNIRSLEIDDRLNLWGSTNNGIFRMDIESRSVLAYNWNDGLGNNEYNTGVSHQAGTGELFFGGIDGVDSFLPSEIAGQDYSSPLVVSELRVMNRVVRPGPGSPIAEAITYGGTIVLEHDQNLFSIEFAVLDYTAPAKNRYAYRLDGKDNNWVEIGNRNFISYNGLSPGNYVLEIKGTNSNGIDSDRVLNLRIIIKPPFYRQTYFLLALALLMLALVVLLVHRQRRKNKRETEKLERTVAQRTRQLEAQKKELASQNELATQQRDQILEQNRQIMSTQKQLSESKAFIESIIASAKDGILVLDLEGNIRLSNYAFRQMVGMDENQTEQANIFSFTPEAEAGRHRRWLEAYRDGEFSYMTFESQLFRKKEAFPVSLSTSFLPTEAGGGVVAIVSDITARKRDAAELDAYRKHLEEMVNKRTADLFKAKNAAERADQLKTSFLKNMSHEIRTPMNAIVGFSELLADEESDEEERDYYTQMIRENSSVLLNLIEDIIKLSELQAGQVVITPHKVDLVRLLAEIHADHEGEPAIFGKEVDVVLDIPKSQAYHIQTDSFRLRQVFKNLISNAIKFTEHGTIWLGFRPVHNQKKVTFFVKDTGIGIPKENLEIIFNNFGRMDENPTKIYRGTGLGLSISSQTVALLGGKLEVVSRIGQGSEFHFTLDENMDFSD